MDGQVYAEHKPERVVDYFVVVGLDPDIVVLEDEAFCDDQGGQGTGSDGGDDGDDGDDGGEGALSRVLRTRYRAAVLDRFPAEDHPDTALPPQVAMFALPEGLTVKVRRARAQACEQRTPRTTARRCGMDPVCLLLRMRSWAS